MSIGIPTISTATLNQAPMMTLKESASERRHAHWKFQLLDEQKICLRCPHCQMITYHPNDIAENYCSNCKIFHHAL